MGTGLNQIATNIEMAKKIGYSGTITNPNYLCTHSRALNYGGYLPGYKQGYDNRCVKYSESTYTCGNNTTTNCTLNISTTRNTTGLKVFAEAVPNSGYNMSSLVLQNDSGTTILTVTSFPFAIEWTPTLNFKFVATATAQTSYTIQYTTNDDNALVFSSEPFDVAISKHTYDKGTGTLTFASAPSILNPLGFINLDTLTSILLTNTIITISHEAFIGCSNLTTIDLGNSVNVIEYDAFTSCVALTSIYIPSTTYKIDAGSFVNTFSLTTIAVSSANPYYTSANGSNVIVDLNNDELIQGCQTSIIPNNVTSIGASAFSGCTGLSTITIPNTVNSIGMYAFEKSGLTAINIPQSVTNVLAYAFYSSLLTSLIIPATLTNIGQHAFSDCTAMTSITCASTQPVTIGTNVFDNTNNCPIYVPYSAVNTYKHSTNWSTYQARIQSLIAQYVNYTTIDGAITTPADPSAFGNAVIVTNTYSDGQGQFGLSENATMVNNMAFISNTSLATIDLPTTVTSIGTGGFNGCMSLTSITMPNVTLIDQSAFEDCVSLTSASLPNTLERINDTAFKLCYLLTSIHIPASVTYIGSGILQSCYSITSITVDPSNTYYTSTGNCIVERSTNILWAGCQNTTIGNGVIAIADYAFCGITTLASITIPNSVTYIGEYAFADCQILTNLIIPNSITYIGPFGFNACRGLTSLFIPSSISYIGNGGFMNCSGLTSITCESTTPATLGGNQTFVDTNNCPIYVPSTAINTYKTTGNWTFYQARILAVQACVINYTSTTGSIVTPNVSSGIGGATLLNNTYSGGQGTYTFDQMPTFIDNDAFYNCTTLSSIILPSTITTIGAGSFKNCTSLTSVNIPTGVTVINTEAFYACAFSSLVLPDTIINIYNNAFAYNTCLTSFTLTSGVLADTSWPTIFSGCTSLTTLTVDTSHTIYDSRNNCNAIIRTADNTLMLGCKTTIIPDTVTAINKTAFHGISTMPSVTIPNSVTYIGDLAFYGCNNFSGVWCEGSTPATLGSTVFDPYDNSPIYVLPGVMSAYQQAWPAYAHRITAYSSPKMCMSSKGLANPNTSTGWGDKVEVIDVTFDKETLITTITFNDDPTIIPKSAFASNKGGITDVTMPNTILTIGAGAFAANEALTTVVIPACVKNINEQAFAYNTKMTSITCEATTPPVLDKGVFDETNDCSIYVPADYVTVYQKAAGWSEYAKRIQAIPVAETTMEIISKAIVTPKVSEGWGASIKDITYNEKTSTTTIIFNGAPSTIPEKAFEKNNDAGIISITVPSTIATIGNYAFASIQTLETIIIPSSVTSIGDNVLIGCTLMSSITCEATTPPKLGTMAFYNTNDCPILVPEASIETYQKAANWSEYSKRFKSIK